MRAIAVLMMIQGHTIDALLSPGLYLRGTIIFDIWQLGRGLTAPIFLFGSGFAYVLATARKSSGGVMGRTLFLKRLRWISILFLVGSLMHFPASSFFGMAGATPEQWNMFYRIDVLRLMAVSLLGLLALLSSPLTRTRIMSTSVVLAFGIAAASPLVHSVDWSGLLPRIIAAFLSTNSGSIFTVFPFSAYIFAGAAVAALHIRLQKSNIEHRFIPSLAVLGIVFLGSAYVLHLTMGAGAMSLASPGLFLLRLGLVLMLWTVVGLLIRSATSVPAIIPVVGQHTLLIYVAHIVVLYGSPWFVGLNRFAGQNLDYLAVGIVIASLLVGSVVLAYTMHRLKDNRFHVYRLVPYAGVALLFLVMTIS